MTKLSNLNVGQIVTLVQVDDANGDFDGSEVSAEVVVRPPGNLEDLLGNPNIFPDDTRDDLDTGVWLKIGGMLTQFGEQPDGTLMWCTYGGGFERYRLKND